MELSAGSRDLERNSLDSNSKKQSIFIREYNGMNCSGCPEGRRTMWRLCKDLAAVTMIMAEGPRTSRS